MINPSFGSKRNCCLNPGFLPPISTTILLAFGELSGLIKYANTAMKNATIMTTIPAIAALFFFSLRQGLRLLGRAVIF
jgi:hypothetical protein